MTPSQAVAQERARLREEVVKMPVVIYETIETSKDTYNPKGYVRLVDVLALLRD
jgi:hypothetical protein